jgi:hypothetical protein
MAVEPNLEATVHLTWRAGARADRGAWIPRPAVPAGRAYASENQTLEVWGLASGRALATLHGHRRTLDSDGVFSTPGVPLGSQRCQDHGSPSSWICAGLRDALTRVSWQDLAIPRETSLAR